MMNAFGFLAMELTTSPESHLSLIDSVEYSPTLVA